MREREGDKPAGQQITNGVLRLEAHWFKSQAILRKDRWRQVCKTLPVPSATFNGKWTCINIALFKSTYYLNRVLQSVDDHSTPEPFAHCVHEPSISAAGG